MLTLDETGRPQFEIAPGMDYDGRSRMEVPKTGAGPLVRFYAKAIQLGQLSLQVGRPQWKSVIHLEIRHPGERDTVDRMATKEDCQKYYPQYLQFAQAREGDNARYQGTPLDTLFPQHPDAITILNFNRVYTVEQLAGLSDTGLGNIGMGAREWQNKAKRYLEATEEGAGFAYLETANVKLQDEVAKLTGANRLLEAKLAEMGQQVNQLLSQVQNSQAYGAPMIGQHQAPAAPQMPVYAVPPVSVGIDPDQPIAAPAGGPVIPPAHHQFAPAEGNFDVQMDLVPSAPAPDMSTSVPPSPPRGPGRPKKG